MIVAALRILDTDDVLPGTASLIVAGVLSTALLFAYLTLQGRRTRRIAQATEPPAGVDEEFDAMAGGFPVPPLPARSSTRSSPPAPAGRLPGGS